MKSPLFFLALLSTVVKSQSPSTTALSTFSPAVGVHASFQERRRSFLIGGHNWTVEQNWDSDGVAGVVWQASVQLGEYLASGNFNFSGKRVVEIGAGTALPGLVAASLGGSVILTDHHSAIHVTRKSAQLNLKHERSKFDVKVRALDWGSDVKSMAPPLDYVLGADVVYLEEMFPALLGTLAALTHCDRSIIILALTIRYKRDLAFLEMLEADFQCRNASFDSESRVLMLHVKKYCPGLKKEALSCSRMLKNAKLNLQ